MMNRNDEREMMEVLSRIFGCNPEELIGKVHCVPMSVKPKVKSNNQDVQEQFGRVFQKIPENNIGFDDISSLFNNIKNSNIKNVEKPKCTVNENDTDIEDEINNNINTVAEKYSPIHINMRTVNGNTTIIEFELAGFSKKDISVVLENDSLIVTATKNVDRDSMSICEIDNRKQRIVTIGKGYTVEDFSNDFKNGILTLSFPSVKKDDSNRIQIL